jgi:hypothetical protein
MIVSFSKRFVFVHIHKCAGESVEKHCAPFLKPWDILLGPGRLGLAQVPSKVLKRTLGLNKHSSAAEIRAAIGARRYDQLVSFAIVRHPEDRMVSLYRYLVRQAQRVFDLPRDRPVSEALDAFWFRHGLTVEAAGALSVDERRRYLVPVRRAGRAHRWRSLDVLMVSPSFDAFIRHPAVQQNPALKSQLSRLVDPRDGTLLVEHVLKLDRLAEDWSELMQRIGIPGALPRHNSSERVEKPTVSTAARAAIEEFAAEDYQAFGFARRTS